jgi:hypothetical protein
MRETIIECLSCMLKDRLNLKWKSKEKKQQYVDFILKIIALFSERGFYGASINQAILDAGVPRSSILGSISKKELFIFVANAAITISRNELFSLIPSDDAVSNSEINKFTKLLSAHLTECWDLCVISLVGNQFNQEKDLIDTIEKAQSVWRMAFFRLAKVNWQLDCSADVAASNCLIYLISQMLLIQSDSISKKKVQFICDKIGKYLKKEIISLLTVSNNG